ncbi:MAG: glycogen phosphorylase [Caulobacteraceae bacterium]|nr:glycogen phosphorylase [Caulobacteraceae bacterium]
MNALKPTPGRGPDQGITAASLKEQILHKLAYAVGKDPVAASTRDWYMAAALATRDHIVDHWFPSTRDIYVSKRKRVYYLSLEFLIGRLLYDAMSNLGIVAPMRQALEDLGVSLEDIRAVESDAALGNGGLGRLAACFMESMASLDIAAYGYGIRYDHGLFRQAIHDGWQHEYPEDWLSFGNPWEFERPEVAYSIGFGGVVQREDPDEEFSRAMWTPGEVVQAVAYDTPVVGWRGAHVNTLRLWSARAVEQINLADFNKGDHMSALAARSRATSISQVLYPSDESAAGEELRLRQEYFFSSAALQDILRRHWKQHGDIVSLPDHVAIQLNDTHPAISVPELMRLLIDVHGIAWADAWAICRRTFSYTNHTLLPEALETWPVALLERVLPRHMQIIYLLNAQHIEDITLRKREDLIASTSLIEEGGSRRVRMGWMSFLGSHHVNGVSGLHTELMRQTVFRDLNTLYPGRIVNKTNGVTFRRWLFEANPALTQLLVDTVGPRVMDDPMALEGFAKFAKDSAVQETFAAIKRANKAALAKLVWDRMHVRLDPDALFDVQIKRIHEYKRQLLNILQTVALYNAMKADPTKDWAPTVKVFAGKAAASYHRAKLIIKLANDVAKVVNQDPSMRGRLKVVFLANYNVSLAEIIIPAADISEQISTAGLEASGTGNMKLALNGAITVGTLDGANVEIKEHVGDDNIFIFGMTAQQAMDRRAKGEDMREEIAASPQLQLVLEQIGSGVFSADDPSRYRELVDALTWHDHFLVCADFDTYVEAQKKAATLWKTPSAWRQCAMMNVAKSGWFSSDRTITEYATEIWNVPVGEEGKKT